MASHQRNIFDVIFVDASEYELDSLSDEDPEFVFCKIEENKIILSQLTHLSASRF